MIILHTQYNYDRKDEIDDFTKQFNNWILPPNFRTEKTESTESTLIYVGY